MNAPTPLRDRLRQSTRDAILAAAATTFNGRDANAVRMEDIAAAAGVAVGTLYNYFRDRNALVAAVLQARTQGLLEALDGVVAEATDTAHGSAGRFAADLQRFVGILTMHGDENRTLMLAMIDEVLEHGVDAVAVNRQHTVATQLMARAGRLLAHGIDTGELRRAEPVFYAAMLLGMVRAVAVTALVRAEAGIAGHSDEIVRVFLTGAAYSEPSASQPAEEVLAR
jgi:AcrR family transcriptional regulator